MQPEHTTKVIVLTADQLKEIVADAVQQGVEAGLKEGVLKYGKIEEWLTVAEAAELLKVKPATLRRWVAERRIPGHYKGNKILLKYSEVMASDPVNLPPARF